ncbi:hypothetical protein SLA2020_460600 [Shorea laevis]
MSRSCSQCGNNGHNSRTCAEAAGGGGGGGGGGGENGIMLFGVRVTAEGSSFRKSVSMNNLSQYDQPPQDSNADAGYASDDVVHASESGRSRERKRGVPWTEDEHRLFLLGLQKVGKGDWRGISRNFVKTRTPTQVASHAQKYFLRRTNQNRRRRRSSLFDITTDTFATSPILEEEQSHRPIPFSQENTNRSIGGFPMSTFPVTLTPVALPPVAGESSKEKLTLGRSNQGRASPRLIRPVPILPIPPSAKLADLNLNQKSPPAEDLPLSLKLSTPSSEEKQEPSQAPPPPSSSSSTHSSAFQTISSGDSIISVA